MSLDQSLLKLEKLKPNWDGHGAMRPTAKAMRTARSFNATALQTGGVEIDLHAGGVDMELGIQPDGAVSRLAAGNRKQRVYLVLLSKK